MDSNISENNNNNKAYNTAFMHKLYAICRIGDQPVLAKLTVEEFLNGKGSTLKRMYNLQDIKTEPLRHIELTDNQLARSVLKGSEISVADLFRVVKALDKDFYLNKQPHEQAKVFQVITNAGDDGGYDEKPEYDTLDEAIQAGNQYIADGYIGFSVYNEETKRIEYVSGQFDVESAYCAEILEINQIPVPSEPTKAAYSPTMQEYFKIKGENPDRIILFQIGAFYEAMGDNAKVVSEALELIVTSRRLSGDEGIEMCGFPENRLETNLNMLLDRGYSVGVSSVDENGNRSFVLMVSDRAHDPVNSEPVGRIDYLTAEGELERSIEYTNPTMLEKDIKEESTYDVKMAVYLYRDKDGRVMQHDFIDRLPNPLHHFEIINKPASQSEQDVLLSRAQELISEYMDAEFGSDNDEPYELPEDISDVNLAYTTTEDEQHEITADANLVDFRIETKIDGKVVRTEQYDSLLDIVENGLDGLRFDDLVYVSDEELAPFYDKPTEEKNDVLPAEKPSLKLTQEDIDSLIIQRATTANAKLRVLHAVHGGESDDTIIGILREGYSQSSKSMVSSSGTLLYISGDSRGIFVGDFNNQLTPVLLTYHQLLQRIKELTLTNRYLSDSEYLAYAEEYRLFDKAARLREVNFQYRVGDTAYLSGQPYIISDLSGDTVTAYQPDAPLFIHTYDRAEFESLLLQNVDDNMQLVVKPQTHYEIYQLVDSERTDKYMFLSLKALEDAHLTIERSNYTLVYTGTLGESENIDSLYERFNVHAPSDFYGHSMSVSDVVVLTRNDVSVAYYCDDVGFTEIPGFSTYERIRDYVLFHPQERTVSWIYFNPDGNLGNGQIVHEFIPVDELARRIDSLSRDELPDYFSDFGTQQVYDIENPEWYTTEYDQYANEQPAGLRLVWNSHMSDENYEAFKDIVKETIIKNYTQ